MSNIRLSQPMGAEKSLPFEGASSSDINADFYKKTSDESRIIAQEPSPPKAEDEEDDMEPHERDLIDQILDEEEAQYCCKGCEEVSWDIPAFTTLRG
jgi:hypothetical protein